jgi:hypothetical protein
VRPMFAGAARAGADDGRLATGPFADISPPKRADPLSRTERWNVVFVVAASQIMHVATVALVTAVLFLILGIIVLSPRVLAEFTRNGPADGEILGMTLPVPGALMQTSMFLGAMTFMYISARTVSDADYRSQFLDPLLDDLQLTLAARHRYRSGIPPR